MIILNLVEFSLIEFFLIKSSLFEFSNLLINLLKYKIFDFLLKKFLKISIIPRINMEKNKIGKNNVKYIRNKN